VNYNKLLNYIAESPQCFPLLFFLENDDVNSSAVIGYLLSAKSFDHRSWREVLSFTIQSFISKLFALSLEVDLYFFFRAADVNSAASGLPTWMAD